MKIVFVTSGKYKTEAEIVPFLDEKLKPDFVYADMQEVLLKLVHNRGEKNEKGK